jgi:hypothetical protein
MQIVIQNAQQTISAILTPALMISACGLLLLGLNNRYATVVGRLRALTEERRRRAAQGERSGEEYHDTIRFESIVRQIPLLLMRSGFLRRALIYLWIGVFGYLSASLCLSFNLVFQNAMFAGVSVVVFMIGVLSAAVGVVFALLDIIYAHKVLSLETEV